MNKLRPPIVTVLGHVDHGKTTLLDAIRKSDIAAREAGGITQGIGASKVVTPEGQITFVDTPGHAAFSKMRARGAKIADIAVLVVAADDGIMPQTLEALSYIKENKMPLIVAITKTDLPSANAEKVQGQLEQEEIFFEGRGGSTPLVEVSVKAGRGIDELVETILLLAGVTGFEADPQGSLSAVVIETSKDKRGVLVAAVVKNGMIRVGDEVYAADIKTKIKGLFDQANKAVEEAVPSDPVLILGFNELPEVGVEITRERKPVSPTTQRPAGRAKTKDGELALILKVKSAGTIEAVTSSLPERVFVLAASVGEVTESDVFLAKTAGAMIVAFEAAIPGSVRRLAQTEGVVVVGFKIIYEIVDYIKELIDGDRMQVLGKAEVLAEFPFNKTRVAGCKIFEGKIQKTDKIVLFRGENKLGETKIASMRREKNVLNEAKAGEECGLVLVPLLPFEKGDILVATK